MNGKPMETVTWIAATACFLIIAYKSYTSGDEIPTKEEILEAVERGVENGMRERTAPDTTDTPSPPVAE